MRNKNTTIMYITSHNLKGFLYSTTYIERWYRTNTRTKGILIKIKLVCENGTNFIKYGSKKELAKNIGIGINQINSKLQPLIDKGYLKYIGKSLHLNPIHFLCL